MVVGVTSRRIKADKPRVRDANRATIKPAPAVEAVAGQMMAADPSLSRNAALRRLMEVGAAQLSREAVRHARIAERVKAWKEMVDREADDSELDEQDLDAGWEAAMVALRGGPQR